MGSHALLALLLTLVAATAAAPPPLTADREALRLADMIAMQNANAHYHFSADVDDQISDLTHHRQETRDGLNLKGSFSYSDGFLRRNVKYEADENGYRVVSDQTESLEGPQVNPDGVASVRTVLSGSELQYSVQNVPQLTERSKSVSNH